MRSRITMLAAIGLLLIASSAMAQSPGSRVGGPGGTWGPSNIVDVRTNNFNGNFELGQILLPLPAFTEGYLVLRENWTGGDSPSNWSDVVVFSRDQNAAPLPGRVQGRYITLISDGEAPEGGGMVQADLDNAGMGLTIAGVIGGSNTLYINEWSAGYTDYQPAGDIFRIASDPPRAPGIGTAGLVLLASLLGLTGVVFVTRRRTAGRMI